MKCTQLYMWQGDFWMLQEFLEKVLRAVVAEWEMDGRWSLLFYLVIGDLLVYIQ